MSIFKPCRRHFSAAILLAFALPGLSIAASPDPREDGPLGLITTVQTAAVDRAELRRMLLKQGLPQLERLKREGRVQDYRVLFSRYADSEGFDALVQLSFARYADVARWREVEGTRPGGLPQEALRLIKTMATVPVDRMREGDAKALSKQPTFLVIPYDYFVSTNDYLKYLDGYVIPQFNGWIDEGVVSRYGLYFSRYAAGRPWASMFLLEYRDDAALGQRDVAVGKVRARLAASPEWRAIADNKQKIRVERAPVIADQLSLPPTQ